MTPVIKYSIHSKISVLLAYRGVQLLLCLTKYILPPFQIIRLLGFSRFITFAKSYESRKIKTSCNLGWRKSKSHMYLCPSYLKFWQRFLNSFYVFGCDCVRIFLLMQNCKESRVLSAKLISYGMEWVVLPKKKSDSWWALK